MGYFVRAESCLLHTAVGVTVDRADCVCVLCVVVCLSVFVCIRVCVCVCLCVGGLIAVFFLFLLSESRSRAPVKLERKSPAAKKGATASGDEPVLLGCAGALLVAHPAVVDFLAQ